MGPLPPVLFITGNQLNGTAPGTAITFTDGQTRTLGGTKPVNISGYNTLSVFITLLNMVAGNTFTVTMSVVDPSTGAAVASGLGDLELVSETTDDDYATTVYLPAYYATLTGLILPFHLALFTLSNTGGNAGVMSVTALKFWLTNA